MAVLAVSHLLFAPLRPMAVRMVHKLQHARPVLSVTRRAAPKSHARITMHLAHTHTKQGVAERRAVLSVVPRPRHTRQRRAPPMARRVQRPLVVQVQPLERLADLAFLPTPTQSRPNPCPQIDHGGVRARRAVEGAHAAQPTPDAGANARSQPAL